MTQKCDSCQLMMIQGVVCHETGCRNAWKTETRKCDWCGSYFTPTDRLDFFCSKSCNCSYNDIPDEDETPTCLECGEEFAPAAATDLLCPECQAEHTDQCQEIVLAGHYAPADGCSYDD